jgi:fermentation-respiration switch protein FrsA (DUF1100 family)
MAVGAGVAAPRVDVAVWSGDGVGDVVRRLAGDLGFVGAALLTLAGAGLLGVAAVATWRRARGWGRLGVAAAVSAVVGLLGLPLGAAVSVVVVPRVPLGSGTPTDRGLAFVDAAFWTTDGVRLSGWYVPSANGAAVVLVPGALSPRTSLLDQAAVLARHGYGVLLMDARGTGRSAGRAMSYGWYGERDIAAAVTFLQARADVCGGRIGVLGESMGAEEAIGAAGVDPRIRAVVAEGATDRVATDWDWLPGTDGVRGRLRRAGFGMLLATVDLLSTAPVPPPLARSAAEAAPRPVLMLAASTQPDEVHAATHLRDRAALAEPPGDVRLWVVPGAGHTGGLRAQPAEWERRVTAFLDAALRGPTP